MRTPTIFRMAQRGIWAAVLLISGGSVVAPAAAANNDVDKRINALIEQMTLAEKLGQLTQQWGGESQDINPGAQKRQLDDLLGVARSGAVGSFLGAYGAEYTNKLQRAAVEESRLKIPLIIGNDVIHGFRTVFPVPLAESATWDPSLVEMAARVAATEARAGGTHWTFAPMIDVCRDARWGRIVETAGEDPYFSAVMAAARVRGFQGESLKANNTVAACAKHYVAYGAGEGGRDYNTVDISDQTLRDIHLPPFAAAVDVGVASVMSAFNEINGTPATANQYTIDTILRGELGFNGFIVSDWTSITEMINHGSARDAADAAQQAIRAGIDMDMCSFSYRDHLDDMVKDGRLSETVIDKAVRRVLRAKFDLGLFENPYADPALEAKVTLTTEHRAAARRVAAKSMVLLKNENALLPLTESVRTIALVGPMVDNNHDPLGTWSLNGKDEDVVSVLAGMKKRAEAAGVKVLHAQGCEFAKENAELLKQAVSIAKQADVVLAFVGENEMTTGEAHSKADINLPAPQLALVKALMAANKKTAVILMTGRPLTIPYLVDNAPAILSAWHPGVECGNAMADVLFGDENPAARLPVTWPRHVGQIPIYYNHKKTGRPPNDTRYTSKYIDQPWTPQFPFGYGLSYTNFAYSNLEVEPSSAMANDSFTVSVQVANTGTRDGDEVVQLYVRDLVGSVTRPVKELKAFERVFIKSGTTQTIAFEVSCKQLGFHNAASQYVVEPGAFKLFVGPNAAEGLEADFEIGSAE